MTARVVASVVVLLALGAIAWTFVGSDSTSPQRADVAATEATPSDAGEARDARSDPTSTEAAATNAIPAEADPSTPAEAPTPEPEPTQPPPENFGPRMDLVDLHGWLNTDATALSDFDGQVLLVEMWTFGCFNCKARIPFNQSYYEEFADENFEIIGVHAPEFSYEADVANIEAALVELGVTWPVALDTDKKNFRAWQPGSRNFWPRTYVIDQNGDVRYDHIGEGKYEELRETIRYLLANPPAPLEQSDT